MWSMALRISVYSSTKGWALVLGKESSEQPSFQFIPIVFCVLKVRWSLKFFHSNFGKPCLHGFPRTFNHIAYYYTLIYMKNMKHTFLLWWIPYCEQRFWINTLYSSLTLSPSCSLSSIHTYELCQPCFSTFSFFYHSICMLLPLSLRHLT